jgi:hypothetical protein
MQSNINEATRCAFITSILNASLAIVRRFTKKNVSGEEAYATKGNESLIHC